ncbi:hypothetical protein MIR68_005409 [Amoeboaphelidium protococcarum]|nr:hypothetical protein MIR68_005409 [Amoeboaphelidium protococcarum]
MSQTLSALIQSRAFWLGLLAGSFAAVIPLSLLRKRSSGGRSWFSLFDHLWPQFDLSSNRRRSLPSSRSAQLNGADLAVREIGNTFRISTIQLHEIIKHFVAELKSGLSKHGQTLKALPSFVTKLPAGMETGTYLALDLGGTNLRVCEVALEGSGKFRLRQKKYVLSDEYKVSDSDALFGYIADCTKEFLDENMIKPNADGQPLLLGFTFSFPVDQTSLDSGILMNWNKGFEVKGTLGNDVVAMMRDAFAKRNLNIKIVAIVNDTVGTLVAHCYQDGETMVGVILGTGTNAAYVESMDNIKKWESHYMKKDTPPNVRFFDDNEPKRMVINIEWGNFDNEGVVLPISKYDRMLDAASENPGAQTLEKMVSGLYMGEIVRYIILDLASNGHLFNSGEIEASKFMHSYSFTTLFMSRIERDHSQDLSDTKWVLEDLMCLGPDSTSVEDRRIVKRVCECVGIRAARLSAACVGGVIAQMNRLSGCTVAIDGSVFEFYPHFKNRMLDALREIFGIAADNIKLELARDGSGVGAALIACVMGGQ